MGASQLVHHVASERKVLLRSRGRGGEEIVRLMSPSDLGLSLKPFVFLDRFEVSPTPDSMVPEALARYYHPHSGIATVTVLMSGEIYFEETTGRAGILPPGGVEYMQAGGGVWHTGSAVGNKYAKGFQLWIALPPELENSKDLSLYLNAQEVPVSGPARVILGSYQGLSSPIPRVSPMTYLHVSLEDGETWSYQPPKGHDVAWAAVYDGELQFADLTFDREIVVFEDGNQGLTFTARGKTDFVIGSALKHPHELVLGSHSVHTSREALLKGIGRIQEIAKSLKVVRGT